MIRTIHKIISFPNRVFGPRTIIRLFSKPFRRFLLIIFTVFRFLLPRFVSPRSKLPIPFIPSPLAFPNFFSTRPNFCAFIYLFRRHVEYYTPDPCRNETFRSSVLDESYLRRSSCYDEYRVVALCKWNTCKGRIGENKEAEGGKFNEIIACRSSTRANRIEANAFFYRFPNSSRLLSEGLERRRDVEKSFDRKIRAVTKILDFYFSSSSRDKNSEDSFNFLEGGVERGAKLTIEEIRWRSKCY